MSFYGFLSSGKRNLVHNVSKLFRFCFSPSPSTVLFMFLSASFLLGVSEGKKCVESKNGSLNGTRLDIHPEMPCLFGSSAIFFNQKFGVGETKMPISQQPYDLEQ